MLSKNDAYWFPVIGSVVLFGFYLLFTFLSKDMINLVLTFYFSLFGIMAIFKLFNPIVHFISNFFFLKASTTKESDSQEKLLPSFLVPVSYKFERRSEGIFSESLIGMNKYLSFFYFIIYLKILVILEGSVDLLEAVTFLFCIAFTGYYVVSKNWIASNVFGEAFSIGAISLLHLDSFITGSVLLAGLFIYDIFWVFGTNVMVTVAKNFDAPVKLLFPRNIFAEKFEFALLGLGDIVIPGIFVALCLRFDHERAGKPSHQNYPKPYFRSCFIAYIIGLATTVSVMHFFKAAQPALLYLSPACILSVIITAMFRGELSVVYNFTAVKEDKKEIPLKKTD